MNKRSMQKSAWDENFVAWCKNTRTKKNMKHSLNVSLKQRHENNDEWKKNKNQKKYMIQVDW